MSKLKIKNKYGIIPNNLLNETTVSLKAKGLFAYLQSKPEEWKFSIERISAQLKEGSESIRGAVKELEELGYLKRTSIKKDGKYNGYDYSLLENPIIENPSTENTSTGIQVMGKPPTLSKKDISKKDIVNNIIQPKQVLSVDNGKEVNTILTLFTEINPTLGYNKTPQRNAVGYLLDKYGLLKTKKLVKYSLDIQTDKFAPIISTPIQLKNSLGKVIIYGKRNKNFNIQEKADIYEEIKSISAKCEKCTDGFITKKIGAYMKSVPCECILHLIQKNGK